VSRKKKSRDGGPPADATLRPPEPHPGGTIAPPPLEDDEAITDASTSTLESQDALRGEERDTLSSPPERVPNPDAEARIEGDGEERIAGADHADLRAGDVAPDDEARAAFVEHAPDSAPEDAEVEAAPGLSESHLRGLLEALIFASDKPVTSAELARLASAPTKHVKAVLAELKTTYARRGIVLDEVAGGWLFRTSVQFAPFVREFTSERPVRLTRAQVETLAIVAYRQPITRPEVDEIRGVDSGATLKLLLERDLVRILGKKDEPGRPMLYGTSGQFLEFFGLKSLKDLPTLREFTELSDESRRVAEATLGEVMPEAAAPAPPVAHTSPPPAATSPPSAEWPEAPLEDEHDTMIPSAPPTGDLEEEPESEAEAPPAD
jgi:segregation and condensation protein B